MPCLLLHYINVFSKCTVEKEMWLHLYDCQYVTDDLSRL
jgi:hypothetical protein